MSNGRLHPPHETSGRLPLAGFLAVAETETVDAVRARLATHRNSTSEAWSQPLHGATGSLVELVIMLGPDGRYAGASPIAAIAVGEGTRAVASVVRADWPSVPASLDREQAVAVAEAAGVAQLPVVDALGRPLGVIPATVLMSVLAAEHREDVHRMAGIVREQAGARHALEDPPLRRLALRLPWLLVGLALSAGGTVLMASFERTLSANVTIAFFIPGIVYLADAIGTQTEAIAVRGLSLARKPLPQLLAREMMVGALIGAVLGLLAFAGVVIGFGDWRLGAAVALSLLTAGTVASSIGLALPWGFARLGIDPAFGAGPVATIIQDVLTILVYFGFMAWLAPGGP